MPFTTKIGQLWGKVTRIRNERTPEISGSSEDRKEEANDEVGDKSKIIEPKMDVVDENHPQINSTNPPEVANEDDLSRSAVEQEMAVLKGEARLTQSEEAKAFAVLSRSPLTKAEIILRLPLSPSAPSLVDILSRIPFPTYFIYSFVSLILFTLAWPGFLAGLLWGLNSSFALFLCVFVCDGPSARKTGETGETPVEEEVATKTEDVVFKGWINWQVDPERPTRAGFSSSSCRCVLARLEGKTLRIVQTSRHVAPQAIHSEILVSSALTKSQEEYDLTNARVSLRPRRLAVNRWWSRKYPICVQLGSPDLPGGAATTPSCFDSTSTSESLSDGEGQPKAVEKKKKKDSKRRLILYARSSREKERWFHLLREASSNSSPQKSPLEGAAEVDDERSKYHKNRSEFAKVMATVLGVESLKTTVETRTEDEQRQAGEERAVKAISMDLSSYKWQPSDARESNADILAAANGVVARIFFDLCRDGHWSDVIKQKLQAKLSTIPLPSFIDGLSLSSLDLGVVSPLLVHIDPPHVDDWGLWVDCSVKYDGGVSFTIETRVNLLKLRTEEAKEGEASKKKMENEESEADSPVEQSAEEEPSSKLLDLVKRAARSKLFQKAANNAKFSKMMAGLAETRLLLVVDVELLEGTLTLNLPPPPSDRIWYGFRRPPVISIRAVPQVGERPVDWTRVSTWIESRLLQLLEKSLVCPNMDDLILPLLSGNDLLDSGYNE